jgi:RNA polymerase sigma-70 factor (ECF subfamily)
MVANATEAEDLTQEVFIQLFRKIGSFRGESAFTTWLHRLTVNHVLMHFRKRGVRLEKTTEEGEIGEIQDFLQAGAERPRFVDRIALDKAISELPPDTGRSSSSTTSKDLNTKRSPTCWESASAPRNPSCIKLECG